MTVRQGSVAYPTSINAAPIRKLAVELELVARRFDTADDTLDRAATTARQTWHGAAAATFGHHMNDRGHVFEQSSERVREATHALNALADTIERTQREYEFGVRLEEAASVGPGSQQNLGDGVRWQYEAVRGVTAASLACSEKLAALAALLGDYTRRSFMAVGDPTMCPDVDPTLQGRDLIVDSLLATQEDRIGPDEIQIRTLSDGSYLVVLPGVTDLTSNARTPWKWVTGGPQDTVRKTANARSSVMEGGPNRYADAVKIALQRAGVPAGAEVTFVGHSYGSYTAVDLARDDAFNSADGTSRGYHVKVRRVYGFGADVDWKMKGVPSQTDVVALNSRDDLVYQAETRFHPELGEQVRRRLLPPGLGVMPVPWYRPVVSRPSGRANQLEVEINGGRQWNSDDGYVSGHHQRNYAESVPQVGKEVDALYERMGSARVRSIRNVRVPEGPIDTVPPPSR